MKRLGMLHLPRRIVFAAIFTVIALLTFLGYVVIPEDAFATVRGSVAQISFLSSETETETWEGTFEGSGVRNRVQDTRTTPGPWNSATDTEVTNSTVVVSTRPSADVSKATEETQINETKADSFEEVPQSLKLKILKIHAGATCGSHGFKVDLSNDSVPMPPWAEGSTPFPSQLTLADPEPTDPYFARVAPDLKCFKEGTDLVKTMSADNVTQCSCLPGYHGDECGIPSPVWNAPDFKDMVKPHLSLRETARRIILAIPANHELDIIHARAQELGDSVTATLIAESDFTAAGEPKDRFVETRAREDPSFLGPQRNSTILLRVNTFPPEGCTNGWVSDQYSRSVIGTEGLPRLHGLQDDDFFLIFDADEIPRRDVLNFLRFYEGYGEPIAFRLRWFIYGFFWESLSATTLSPRPTRIEAGCSVGMLRLVYKGDPYSLRHEDWVDEAIDRAREYENAKGIRLRTFEVGSEEHPGGYHCSWCFRDPLGVQVKLVSAQLADGPRWGNFKDRLGREYLGRIVEEGEWFDGSENLGPTEFLHELYGPDDAYKDFAPTYMLRNFDEYLPILVNPSERRNSTLVDIYRLATKLLPGGELELLGRRREQ